MQNLYLIVIGQFISLIGTSMQTTAIPLYILHTAGSGLLVSATQIISIVVTVLFSPLAGVLGDRYNRKNLLIASNIISGTLVLALTELFDSNIKNILFFFICQALCMASECMLLASLMAIVADFVPNEKLTKANSIRSMATYGAMIVGPVLGGVVYGFLGIETIFLINALSFFASAIFACLIHYVRPAEFQYIPKERTFFNDLKEIIVYIKDNKPIRRMLNFMIIVNLADSPIIYVILPYLVMKVMKIDSQGYGLIQSLYMGGFVLGGVILSIKHKQSQKMLRPSILLQYAATLLLAGLSIPLLAPLGSVVVIAAILLVVGLCNSISGTILMSQMQMSMSRNMLSRFGSILNMLFQISIPLGLLVVGLLIDHLQVYLIFIPLSAFLLLFAAFRMRDLFPNKKEDVRAAL